MKENKDKIFSAMNDVPAYAESNKRYVKPAAPDVETVEIKIDGEQKEKSETLRFSSCRPNSRKDFDTQSYSGKGADYSRRIFANKKSEGKLIEERILDGEFVESVSVFDWSGDFGFYEKFKSDAERFRNKSGSLSPHVPFFAYVPQYSQMKKQQFDFYFFMRDEIRSNRYPMADLSYLLLMIYEIINLGDTSDNKKEIDILCHLWTAYRTVYPVLDKYLSEWAADYCLIHSVRLPETIRTLIPHIAARSSLKEFYLEEAFSTSEKDFSVFSDCLITCCSDYLPRKSRYISDDPSLFKKIKAVFTEAIGKMASRRIGIFSPDLKCHSVVRRDAYSGSLCSYSVKKRLAVRICSPFRSQSMRKLITEILRYCENIIRKNVGIRSRLTVDLPFEIRELIDAGIYSRPAEESYLTFYDAPDELVSIESALDLEESSWVNTERLVGETSDDETEIEPDGAVVYDPYSENGRLTDRYDSDMNLSPDCFAVLSEFVKCENDSFEEICRKAGLFPDSVASEINETFSSEIGDIILDNSSGKYTLYNEYLNEIVELLQEKGDLNAPG